MSKNVAKPKGGQAIAGYTEGMDIPLPDAETFRPHRRDCDPPRGVLQYVPRQGVNHVMDFGAPTTMNRERPEEHPSPAGIHELGLPVTNTPNKIDPARIHIQRGIVAPHAKWRENHSEESERG